MLSEAKRMAVVLTALIIPIIRSTLNTVVIRTIPIILTILNLMSPKTTTMAILKRSTTSRKRMIMTSNPNQGVLAFGELSGKRTMKARNPLAM